ncbi:MAG: HAD-IA family hydrolase [Thiohalomonadaceae bacterium]
MSEFKLVVFDWDGTLMDSEARIVACLRAAVTDLALAPRTDEQYRNIIGLGLAEALQNLFPEEPASTHAALVERYRHHFLDADTTPSTLFEGAADTVRVLAERGLLLAVATGKGRRGLDRVLAETGMGQWFHATRCADETFSKPHPQMLLEIMDVLGADPRETLMVGDTEYDMQLARNAGASAVAVSYGVHALERLLAHGPLGHIDDIRELIPWMDRRLTYSRRVAN